MKQHSATRGHLASQKWAEGHGVDADALTLMFMRMLTLMLLGHLAAADADLVTITDAQFTTSPFRWGTDQRNGCAQLTVLPAPRAVRKLTDFER